jgi:hypothetical protein
MANSVITTSVFEKALKRLIVKFPSLVQDIVDLSNQLAANPKIGTAMGKGIYKIRLSTKDKKGSKKEGFRVITYCVEQKEEGKQEVAKKQPNKKEEQIKFYNVYLIDIYDKSEEDNILKEDILKLIKKLFEKK